MDMEKMKKSNLVAALTLAAALAQVGFVASAHAQAPVAEAKKTEAKKAEDKKTVDAELKQFLVQTEGGKEVLRPATEVKPGDLVEYRVVYTNRGTRPVRDIVAELPIPVGLEYQPRSAQPRQGVQFSAGADFGAEPLMRSLPNGKKEAVPYNEYRRVRWTSAQIAAGAKFEVVARARVSKTETQK